MCPDYGTLLFQRLFSPQTVTDTLKGEVENICSNTLGSAWMYYLLDETVLLAVNIPRQNPSQDRAPLIPQEPDGSSLDRTECCSGPGKCQESMPLPNDILN